MRPSMSVVIHQQPRYSVGKKVGKADGEADGNCGQSGARQARAA